jgi:hypothetical protein
MIDNSNALMTSSSMSMTANVPVITADMTVMAAHDASP